jgi:RNA polymerase sigma factor (sigma-70 family)
VTTEDVRSTIEAIWRLESARILAGLTRLVRDVDLAEQVASDAFVAALQQWPDEGVPDNPAAWLMTTARRRCVDVIRRDRRMEQKHAELARELEAAAASSGGEDAANDEFRDDVLRLMFLCCHPVLPADARIALTLRLLAGLSTEEIARAHLTSEVTVAQRIVRAKQTLAEQRIAFEIPDRDGIVGRLASVLEVLYLVFNEGYAVTSGEAWTRADLCEEALRLARVLAHAMPNEAEVHSLVALMELQSSRLGARSGAVGDAILLLDQDRLLWNQGMIRRGVDALTRAAALGDVRGRYRLQAEIAACHARAATVASTDWTRIVALYGEILAIAPSPVVELNRAVAVAMAFGPAAGLYLVDCLADEPSLAEYHWLPAVRADLLLRLGRRDEAMDELRRAIGMTRNEAERSLIRNRLARCDNREHGAR